MTNIAALILYSVLFSTALNAADLTNPCGDYLLRAKVIMQKGIFSLVINPGTGSEINLAVERQQSNSLAPYLDRTIETKVKIEKEMDETIGEIKTLGPIEALVPDPLSKGKGTSMKLINKIDCKKN